MTWSSWQVNFLAWYPPAPLVLKVPEDAVSLVALPGQPVGTHLEYFQLGGFQWQVLRSVGLCLSPCHSNSVSPLYSLFFSSHSLFSLLSTPPPPSLSRYFSISHPLFSPHSPFFPFSISSPSLMISPRGKSLVTGLSIHLLTLKDLALTVSLVRAAGSWRNWQVSPFEQL